MMNIKGLRRVRGVTLSSVFATTNLAVLNTLSHPRTFFLYISSSIPTKTSYPKTHFLSCHQNNIVRTNNIAGIRKKMTQGGHHNGSQFGDTTLMKVFVGGLAWETPKDAMRDHFEKFGEILEAVIISDKITGRSKGYGFVTFKEAESAKKACEEATPVINGRRANCNLASLGARCPRSAPTTPPPPQQGSNGPTRSTTPAPTAPPANHVQWYYQAPTPAYHHQAHQAVPFYGYNPSYNYIANDMTYNHKLGGYTGGSYMNGAYSQVYPAAGQAMVGANTLMPMYPYYHIHQSQTMGLPAAPPYHAAQRHVYSVAPTPAGPIKSVPAAILSKPTTIGSNSGMSEVGYLLYRHVMSYNPDNPNWFNRDRFVLSAGHGCLLQYVCLHLAGFHSVQMEDLKRLCLLGSRTPGHPENILTDGIEVTTGPLGQGVANAVGLALAEAHLAARFNKPDATIVDHRTYCIMGDGCAMEGISNEAASLAAHWKLNKLTLIYDDNKNTIDGSTALAFSEDVSARFKALGWHTITVDNIHEDMGSFHKAIQSANSEKEKPTFIRVKTLIGRLSKKEGTSKAHHGTFDEDDQKQMRERVNWGDREPFHVIPMVYREMQIQAENGARREQEWNSKLRYYQKKYPREAEEFNILLYGGLIPGWETSLPAWAISDPVNATRGYSETCLNQLAKVIPGLIGGSADLATSNLAYLHGYGDFSQPDSPWGRNIRYGVREHAMAAISNGIALHGSGLIPFAATFLTFSDYMKNAIRLSALSYAGVLYIMTHDSIGLGEDGPTHQPVEQLAGLRAIPRLLVLRPGDGNETAGAYRVAMKHRDQPSLIALSRQKLAANIEGTSADAVEKGGYIVSDNSGKDELPEIILIGTGSELCLCEATAKQLRQDGRKVRVVSLVCWRIFDRQPRKYKELVLPPKVTKRMSVEAGSPLGWREYVGDGGVVVGVDEFGASGAYLDTFKKYGFTEENITKIAKSLLDAQ